MKNPYDQLYKQINMKEKPFGYTLDYFIWRTSKLKRDLSSYIKKNGLILDVGGGFGVMSNFLPNFIDRKNNYINLDVSIEMLKYSRQQNVLAVAEFLPFSDNLFQYIVMSEVLEHVNDKRITLEKCYALLKAEGLLLLTTPRTGWYADYEKSPFVGFVIIDRILNSIVSKLTPKHMFVDSSVVVPDGVIDEPSDERWLRETLEKIGFHILKQYRADNHVPWNKNGENRFWRLFADRFVNPLKFGHCTVVICVK